MTTALRKTLKKSQKRNRIQKMILPFLMICSQAAGSTAKIQDLANELSKEQKGLTRTETQRRSLLGELYKVNKTLRGLNEEGSRLEKKVQRTEETMRSLNTSIRNLSGKLDIQRKKLRVRLKVLSKIQGQGVARVLFSSQSAGQMDLALRVLRVVTERDFRLMKDFSENLVAYRDQKGNLSLQETRHAKLKREFDEKKIRLAMEAQNKKEVLAQVDTERLLRFAKIKRLRIESIKSVANDEELRKVRVLENLLRPQMFERKGNLDGPVQAPVAQGYGILEDVEDNTRVRFKGQQYQTDPGQRVTAVYDGQAVFRGWIDGYGKTMVIDHGNQYYSVYANLGEFEIEQMQEVREGDLIGFTGRSQGFFGSGLYFEIRHFSDPEDPSKWIGNSVHKLKNERAKGASWEKS